MTRILVAGIGNVFLGDDAFGVEVVRRLKHVSLPDGVDVVDFGIRGFDLAFSMMDSYDATILIDTTRRGASPGTLYVIEPDSDDVIAEDGGVDTHNIDPAKVLSLIRTFGGEPRNLYVVGCEPESFGDEEQGSMGLSEPVQASLENAVRTVESLVNDLLSAQTGAYKR